MPWRGIWVSVLVPSARMKQRWSYLSFVGFFLAVSFMALVFKLSPPHQVRNDGDAPLNLYPEGDIPVTRKNSLLKFYLLLKPDA